MCNEKTNKPPSKVFVFLVGTNTNIAGGLVCSPSRKPGALILPEKKICLDFPGRILDGASYILMPDASS
jgi:hypothetical protein